MEIIERNAGRLRRLVDTLLDFSRIQDGRLEPEFAAVDLGALTRGIAQSFAPAMQRAGLRFTVDCPAETGAVRADPELWERIVLNLLSNALKFTREGEVRLSLVPTDETVELRVEDTGIGIAEDELPHVFERFRQARTDGARSHEGSGIGLALVRELAALHDGEARATSRPGRGTTLTVRIPAVRPPAAQPRAAVRSAAGDYVAEALQWSAPPTPARSAAAPPPAAGAGTVLVAEDNADLRAYLTSLLEPFYAVELASDGDEALELARSLRPDLVLADVMMPGRDGFDLLRALRAEPATARTPVVFLSARAGEEAAVEGLAAGADDYLAKPFSSTDLLARIRSNLDLARLRNHESAWRTALVNAMQDGFFVANSELAVIEVNDAFTQLLGYPAAQLPWPVPHPWWPTAEQDPEGFALVRDALAAVRATGAARVVLPLNHRDGRRLWMDVALDSLHDRDGDRKLLIGTLRDVTTQHLAAERDAAVARLADLLAGIDDGPRVLRVALAELRDCWQARRVSLLRWDEADEPDTTATTGPVPPAGPELPPVRAARHARTGRLFTEPDDDTAPGRADSRPVSAVGAPSSTAPSRACSGSSSTGPAPSRSSTAPCSSSSPATSNAPSAGPAPPTSSGRSPSPSSAPSWVRPTSRPPSPSATNPRAPPWRSAATGTTSWNCPTAGTGSSSATSSAAACPPPPPWASCAVPPAPSSWRTTARPAPSAPSTASDRSSPAPSAPPCSAP